MDATTSFIVSGMTGCAVDVVVYDEGQTRLLKTQVHCPMPLRLQVTSSQGEHLRAGRRVMLLAQHEGTVMRADGHLNEIRRDPNGTFLELTQVHWELIERRRHVRVPVTIPVSLKVVIDGEEQPEMQAAEGATLDMSISGAFVQMAEPPAQGSLVEFCAEIDGEVVRTLAVVAHSAVERGGVGLHFVEYLDNARFQLHGFLAKAA